jgi:hypothetical protein
MEQDLLEELITWVRSRYFGKYRGTVTDNNDPTSRGRLKVKVPAVLTDLEVWAVPCVPYAGDGVGTYLMPEVGSGVWIEFEGGDPAYPIWAGCFWADDEVPEDEHGTKGEPALKIIRSQQGLMFTLDDNGQTITLSDQNGDNLLTMEVQQGKVKIQATLKVVVEAPQIELVENATHPLVFGDNLLQYLNQLVMLYQSHIHPGEMALGIFPITPAPPTPPFPPATPDLLSIKVKTG